jgi:hypothetical protein
VNATGHKWEPLFSVTYQLPVGAIGATKEEVKLMIPATPSLRMTLAHQPGR